MTDNRIPNINPRMKIWEKCISDNTKIAPFQKYTLVPPLATVNICGKTSAALKLIFVKSKKLVMHEKRYLSIYLAIHPSIHPSITLSLESFCFGVFFRVLFRRMCFMLAELVWEAKSNDSAELKNKGETNQRLQSKCLLKWGWKSC